MIELRPWQQEAINQAVSWFEKDQQVFLVNAAPGSGKTIFACAVAKLLFDRDEIDRVVVIAPRREVVRQWAGDFSDITGRHMMKLQASDDDVENMKLDTCATWAAVQGLSDAFSEICRTYRTLVICDEHHHAAVEAAWGRGANNAFNQSRFSLILTGTPIRSDGGESVWLAYDDEGKIDHPEEGTYTLSYGEAVDLGYCRPVTFHRHEGHFTVDLENGEQVTVSSRERSELPEDLKRIPALQRALDFYKLACSPQFEADGKTPSRSSYQATMVEYACAKLDDLRERMPEAGGLVIAPNIEMAKYFAALIELLDGEKPYLVHSNAKGSDRKIDAFRKTDARWIVSVAMISEGVDIKRLRLLVYLPSAMTELAFRQAIGRVVRTFGREDDTRAYVVMPSFDLLESFARKVEDEMSAAAQVDSQKSTKTCPICLSEVARGEGVCTACGHEFPKPTTRLRNCDDCGAPNPVTAKTCQTCGSGLGHRFTISLDEALRTGAIVRGMDIDEDEVRLGESVAKVTRQSVLESGDPKLIKIIRSLPEESWGRLKKIMSDDD